MSAVDARLSSYTVDFFGRTAADPSGDFTLAAPTDLYDGFPFLANVTSGEIVEPVFRYLYARAAWTRQLVVSSATAAVENLRLWWGYLEWRGLDWSAVTSEDIDTYRRGLARLISPHTGLEITEGTVRQRMTHVLNFYLWSNRQGSTSVAERYLTDPDNLSGGRIVEARVRPFTYEEWTKLMPYVGPLPTDETYHPEHRRCRDRLVWELLVHCGMRRMELCAITVAQVQALIGQLADADADDLFAVKAMRLTVVKGGPRKSRNALVPVWLIREFRAYLLGKERRSAEDAYAKEHGGRRPAHFFLNHAASNRAPGAPLQPPRLDAVFNEIMRRAGMIKVVSGTDPSTGRSFDRKVATHCVHDLRHTAAVWRYMAERRAGNPAPWKEVQVMLGHADETVTRRIYLRVTDVFEAAVSDASLDFFRRLAAASRSAPAGMEASL